jgi:hypothetical protein
MTSNSESDDNVTPIAAVVAGGAARQIRVQFRGSPTLGWRKFGVYSRRRDAESCAERLRAGGYAARVLEMRVAPVAG